MNDDGAIFLNRRRKICKRHLQGQIRVCLLREPLGRSRDLRVCPQVGEEC